MFHRKRIENHPATDGDLRRVSTHNKTIAEHANYRCFEAELHETFLAGTYLAIGRKHTHPRENFSGAEVNTHALTGTERARRLVEQLH